MPCPNCGFYQPFVWDNMVFDKDKWPEGGVQYRCAECGCLDNEYRWKKNSLKGKWHAEHPERAVRGFHMNKIGSTLCGWDKIVEDFIAADLDAQRGDYEKMQVFVNTDLGLPWEEPGETVEANNLMDRREFYEAEVPDGVVYLTAGVDTQDNRFEVEVVGWGIGKESWGIRYQRIYGDLKRGQVWADLDEFLSKTWKRKMARNCPCGASAWTVAAISQIRSFVSAKNGKSVTSGPSKAVAVWMCLTCATPQRTTA